MGIFDNIRGGILSFLFPQGDIDHERQEEMQQRRNYRTGKHKVVIKPKPGKSDDNIYLNFSGLVIDRSVSMLFGKGVEFDLPGEGDETPEDKYLQGVWDANKKQIFLHRLALLASEDGTGYIKVIPSGVFGRDGKEYARLVSVDPKWVTMRTNPEDFEQVIEYTIRFNTIGLDGKELARKQVHTLQEDSTWMIEDYQASQATSGKWALMDKELFTDSTGKPLNFPQILHFQNLPSADDVYGTPDLTDDLMRLQDKMNFVASNLNKIIRLHAHPKTLGFGFGADNKDVLNLDAGEMIMANNENAFMKTLELQSDLSSSSDFLRVLRQAFFDITRTVDIDSIADKLGALTNFGLKVLYLDTMEKIETKKQLYGDALIELNRRLLVLGGFEKSDPGVVIWPEIMPVNGFEVSNELTADINMGILDKKSAAIIKGYDWEMVQERLAGEQVEQGNVGEQILRGFLGGRQ